MICGVKGAGCALRHRAVSDCCGRPRTTWWERSVNPTNATNFANVNNNGDPSNNNNASNTNGVCP